MSFNIKHGLIDEPTDLGLRLDAQVCFRSLQAGLVFVYRATCGGVARANFLLVAMCLQQG